MAKIDFKGIDTYAKMLARLESGSEEIVKRAVYEGAAVVADAIKEGLKSIPIQEGKNGLPPIGTPENPLHGITRKQKGDLLDSFGLAPMENKNGYIQTKAGVDGYGSTKTKAYPQGLPNVVLLRSIESGTSFRKKTPVIRRAVTKSRKQAEKVMDETINKELEKIFR